MEILLVFGRASCPDVPRGSIRWMHTIAMPCTGQSMVVDSAIFARTGIENSATFAATLSVVKRSGVDP